MLVASSFDLWQKDTFFAAAEEVQQSADIMESAYRTWERERREGVFSGNSDEFCRELQTALGTAKWQLEEFEKAIRLSYRNRDDDFTMARHRHFVDAIETQIARVEKALQESFSKQGNQPIRWVNLNEEECDDLAAFISGTLGAAQTTKEECAKIGASISSSSQENTCLKKKGGHTTKVISYHTKGSDILASNMDAEYIIDIESTEIRETRDDINCQVDRTSSTRRTWSSPDIGTFKVVIRDEDEQKNALASISEATPKDKGSKPFFSRKSCGDRHEAKGGILSYSQLRGVRWINKIMGQVGGCQRKLQTPIHSNLSSVRYKLALLLTIFLIVHCTRIYRVPSTYISWTFVRISYLVLYCLTKCLWYSIQRESRLCNFFRARGQVPDQYSYCVLQIKKARERGKQKRRR